MKLNEIIDNWFTAHPATPEQADAYQQIRIGAHDLAIVVDQLVPDSTEKDLAFYALRSAAMWANAGIACGGATAVAE